MYIPRLSSFSCIKLLPPEWSSLSTFPSFLPLRTSSSLIPLLSHAYHKFLTRMALSFLTLILAHDSTSSRIPLLRQAYHSFLKHTTPSSKLPLLPHVYYSCLTYTTPSSSIPLLGQAYHSLAKHIIPSSRIPLLPRVQCTTLSSRTLLNPHAYHSFITHTPFIPPEFRFPPLLIPFLASEIQVYRLPQSSHIPSSSSSVSVRYFLYSSSSIFLYTSGI
jgi:hypothetical protein